MGTTPDTAETMDATITSAVLHKDTLVINVLSDSPAATACRVRITTNSPVTNAATTRPQAGGNSPPMVAPASAAIDKAATIVVSVLGFIEILSSGFLDLDESRLGGKDRNRFVG